MIDLINQFMKSNLWMDFEIVKIGIDTVELHGFLDEADEDIVIIRFHDVYALNLTTRFTYEGEQDFISIAEGSHAYGLNMQYNVTVGNKIYLLHNTNIQAEMFVIAESVDMEVVG